MSLPQNRIGPLSMSKWRIKRSGPGLVIVGQLHDDTSEQQYAKITGVSEVYISANDGKIYAKFAETSPYHARGKMELFTDGW